MRIEFHGTATTKCLGSLYRARYYDPVRSRFVGEDPIGVVGGDNAYTYAKENPLAYTDPLGLQASCPGPTERDCRTEFFKCLGNQILSPGWSTVTMGAGEAAGPYYGAKAFQHAASRGLSYPLKSSVVRGALSVSRAAGPVAALGSIIAAEGVCLLREIDCVNSQ